ncbi:MAG TPA: DUF2442 domain-containing protein [Bryobacteraceae bacterium]|nr:DUF2442 domain-containing protein [Bryobacteraceae bacterium]
MSRFFGILIRMHSEAGEPALPIEPKIRMTHDASNPSSPGVRDRRSPYTIRTVFEDRTEQVINFEPVLRGEWYGPLRNPAAFNQVRLDPEARTLVWPNGADFDPATPRLAELQGRIYRDGRKLETRRRVMRASSGTS